MLPNRSALKAVIAALALAVSATQGSADLTTAESAQVEKLRGVQVLSADGGLVGLIEGASITPGRAALFLRSASGSFLRYRGKDIVILTQATEIDLTAGGIVLSANAQRIKNGASLFEKDDEYVTIALARR